MIVMKLVSISLIDAAQTELSYRAYKDAEQWAKQFDPSSEKMVIGLNVPEAVKNIRGLITIPERLACQGVTPNLFMLHLADSKVENGAFWEPCWIRHGFTLSPC